MSVRRMGSTKKYEEGWERAFGRKPAATAGTKKKARKAAPKRTSAKKKKS